MTEVPNETPSTEQKSPAAASTVPWLTPRDLPVEWSWAKLFGREPKRLEIELGCGKGAYLGQASLARPESCFFGVDYAGKYLRKTKQRLEKRGAENVVLYYGTHEGLLLELPPDSVDVLHAYFPDPWHKDRHARRRFLRAEMLQWVWRALKPGGELRLRTDVAGYFEQMVATLRAMSGGFELDEPLVYASLPSPDWHPTNYESKFLLEGFECHALRARKILFPPKEGKGA